MSFLAPLFLLGAVAVAAPILFHLIRRTSRQHIPFSSLMFLSPTPPRVTRKSRLENLLLLLLRCAVIALLAIAFARPFLRQPTASAVTSLKRSVLLVDVSASMQRDGLWTEAKQRAVEMAREAGPADEFALVTFDGSTRTVLSFDDWRQATPDERANKVRQRLDAIGPGWGTASLGHALISAAELVAAQDSVQRSDIVVLSDMAQGSQIDALQGFTWPKHLSVAVLPLKTRQVSNAGIQVLPDESGAWGLTSGKAGIVRARISNSSESQKEQFELRWSTVTTSKVSVYVPPGQSRTVELPKPGAPDRLILSGDDADFDNVAAYVPPQQTPVDVVYIGGDDPTDPHRLLYYLQRAFQHTAGQSVRVTQVGSAGQVSVSNAALFVVSETGPETAATVRKAVQNGATALVPMTSPAQVAFVTELASTTVTAEEAASARYAMLGEVDFTHPLFSPFSDPRFSDFTKIHFWKHRRVSFEPSSQARVLARFDNGDPALAQFKAGNGNVFVLASGWQPTDSQLALSSKFVPLLFSMLEFGGAAKSRPLAYVVGDNLSFPGADEGGRLTLQPMQGRLRVLAGPLPAALEPGLYTAESSGQATSVAVNVPADESRTAPMNIEELATRGVPLAAVSRASVSSPERSAARLRAAEMESRQKLWRWLIAAVVVILVIETFVAARSSRGTTAEATP